LQANVDKAREDGAEVVVLLSHDGFDVDRKLATVVSGIDVIVTGHTHDAIPHAIEVGDLAAVVGLARQVSRPYRPGSEGRQGGRATRPT
jgi:2',3'-cyclic-nucleotide 2'-phosphodiesterase (5'-nucleotidase family)